MAWAGWQGMIRLTAPGRVDPALTQALAREPCVNVAVTLPFPTEDFHVRLFQEYGVASRVRGTTVLLNRVAAEEVGRIARHYWVRRIALR